MNNMPEHRVTLIWERGGAEFLYQKYPRDHNWIFDGGHTMTATAAPAYLGSPANVDPEEAFVASLSSCHMLTFLAIACKQKFLLILTETRRLAIWRKMPKGKWPLLVSSFARRLPGVEIEHPAQNSSTKCTMPHTRIVSLPTLSKPR